MKSVLLLVFLLAVACQMGMAGAAWHRKFIEECNPHCGDYSYPLYKNDGIMDCCAKHTDNDASMKDWLCHRNTAICIYE